MIFLVFEARVDLVQSLAGADQGVGRLLLLLPGGFELLALLLALLGGAFDALFGRLVAFAGGDQLAVLGVDLVDEAVELETYLLEGFLGVGLRQSQLLEFGLAGGEAGVAFLGGPVEPIEFFLKWNCLLAEGRKAVAAQEQFQPVQFLLECLVAAGPADLSAQIVDLTLHLGDDVLDAGQVGLGRFELVPGGAPPRLVFSYTGCFFEDAAPVFGPFADDFVDHALLHHRVRTLAQAGIHEQVGDVEQPARDFVHQIVALTRAEEAAGEGHLAEFDGQDVVGVFDDQVDLGHAQGLAVAGAGEDHILHAVAAEYARPLLAQNPAYGLDHVGFAAAVGPDDGRYSRTEGNGDLLSKRLEAEYFELVQAQNRAPYGQPGDVNRTARALLGAGMENPESATRGEYLGTCAPARPGKRETG